MQFFEVLGYWPGLQGFELLWACLYPLFRHSVTKVFYGHLEK